MTAPAFLFCHCGHTARRHLDGDGACDSKACGCGEFRLNTNVSSATTARAAVAETASLLAEAPLRSVPRPRDLPPPPMPKVVSVAVEGPPKAPPGLFARAAASSYGRTRNLGAKIEGLLADLAARVEYEEQLAAAEAEANAAAERARQLRAAKPRKATT